MTFPRNRSASQWRFPPGSRPTVSSCWRLPVMTCMWFLFNCPRMQRAEPGSSFRTDLPRDATRLFRLVSGSLPRIFQRSPPSLQPCSPPPTAHEAILGNGLLLVKVPAGHQDFAAGKPLAEVPAPILGLARKAQPAWMATGSFSAPSTLRVDSMDARMVESGPLFATYQVTYKLDGGKSYTATLELRAKESYVRIAESVARLHARRPGFPATQLWQGASRSRPLPGGGQRRVLFDWPQPPRGPLRRTGFHQRELHSLAEHGRLVGVRSEQGRFQGSSTQLLPGSLFPQ